MARSKTMTIKLPAALSAKVGRLAKKRRATQSEIVREALAAYEPEDTASFVDAAAEFIGMAEGPGDLSTNPRHLRGYGK